MSPYETCRVRGTAALHVDVRNIAHASLDAGAPVAQTEAMQEKPRATPSWAERWVRFLDDGFTVPGTSIRVGADAVLGFFVPALGDAASAVMSASLFALALERKVPAVVLARMLVNV